MDPLLPAPAAAVSPNLPPALSPPPPPANKPTAPRSWGAVGFGFLGFGLAVLAAGAFLFGVPIPGLTASGNEKTVPAPAPLGVELVPSTPHTLLVPEDVRTALGIRKGKADAVAVAAVPSESRPLVLAGSTELDPARLARIRVRFTPAEMVEIGTVVDSSRTTSSTTELRELRPGDRVKKGYVLAVLSSVDVGSKKNDLIDALLQLAVDQDAFDRVEKGAVSGAVPEAVVVAARNAVERDHNNVGRAANTLKNWGIPEEDIDAARKEAEEIGKRKGKRDPAKDALWPRVVLKAPQDGTVVECNVAPGETIVDNTLNLFQIAQVDRLLVLVNAPEDELPALVKLGPAERRWTVRTAGAAAGLEGPITDIGYRIDPNQHSAVLKGRVENPEDRLRAGQYVTATVRLPPPEDVVEIPTGALADDGKQTAVFVQTGAKPGVYTLRRVEVVQRFDRTVFVRSKFADGKAEQPLTPAEKEDGLLPRHVLEPGEKVITSGVLELKKELEDRESEGAKE
jgi:membrane fusion protein, heavy metal efflux system